MNIYDPSDVEAIWKPQEVRKPSETKNMFYRWFIKTGRGNSEEARGFFGLVFFNFLYEKLFR